MRARGPVCGPKVVCEVCERPVLADQGLALWDGTRDAAPHFVHAGDCVFYCDPPYHPATRTSPDVYRHEMAADRHAELLDVLKACEGKVLLSCYRCPPYDIALAGWRRVDFDLP